MSVIVIPQSAPASADCQAFFVFCLAHSSYFMVLVNYSSFTIDYSRLSQLKL